MIKRITQKDDLKQGLFAILTILVLSFLITSVTIVFAQGVVDMNWIITYFKEGLLIFMNFIPIFVFMVILYLIFNKLWLSFTLSSILFVTLSMVNKYKLAYRDDPFQFIELRLIKESFIMVGKYNIRPDAKVIAVVLIFALGIHLVKKYLNLQIQSKRIRLISLAIVILISTILFKPVYLNPKTYAKVGNKEKINIWISSEQFKSKGFIYPFIYSAKDIKDVKPEGYDQNRAASTLNKNEYKNIPEDKKVNVIAVMLEAFNDFSEFEGVELNPIIYENFHELQKESIHGKLVTKIFGGDTIKTEREFLTGYYNHPKYYKKTDSFVWYLKEQGYRTEGMHPITGSFYNRKNINEYLGFDYFEHLDNRYNEVPVDYLRDIDFFDYIIEGYENNKANNQPYFNFSVTYQNHGPYASFPLTDEEYLKWDPTYDEETYNIVNNYLWGINQTDKALKKLFDYYRNEEEPTVIIVFGDHNPWLGPEDAGYSMMNINLDLGTVEGYKNYYQTPYLIWGNDSAKSRLNNDLVGEGNTISPNYLMAELFQHLGWKGNQYMQYLMDMKEKFDVINPLFFKENGEYTKVLSLENQELWKEFLIVEYYISHH